MVLSLNLSDFIALLAIYDRHILVCALAACVLSFWGTHLASQNRVLESFCYSQAASLGSLIGLHFFWLPLFPALVGAAACQSLLKRLQRNTFSERTAIQASVYALLLALSLLLIRLSSRLEAHATQTFFGDIATLSDQQIWIAGIGFCAFGIVGFAGRRRLLKESFQQSVLQRKLSLKSQWLNLGILSLSISLFGVLFTIAFLFIPTSLLQFKNPGSASKHHLYVIGASAISVLLGFIAALAWPNLTTTPSLIAFLFLVCLGLRALQTTGR